MSSIGSGREIQKPVWNSIYHLMEVADAYLGPLCFCLLFLLDALSFFIKNNSKPSERCTYLQSQPKREGLGKTMLSFIAMCNYCWHMEEEADFMFVL